MKSEGAPSRLPAARVLQSLLARDAYYHNTDFTANTDGSLTFTLSVRDDRDYAFRITAVRSTAGNGSVLHVSDDSGWFRTVDHMTEWARGLVEAAEEFEASHARDRGGIEAG